MELVGAAAAVELDDALLAVLLVVVLLELPHPATISATTAISSPVALPIFDLRIGS